MCCYKKKNNTDIIVVNMLVMLYLFVLLSVLKGLVIDLIVRVLMNILGLFRF